MTPSEKPTPQELLDVVGRAAEAGVFDEVAPAWMHEPDVEDRPTTEALLDAVESLVGPVDDERTLFRLFYQAAYGPIVPAQMDADVEAWRIATTAKDARRVWALRVLRRIRARLSSRAKARTSPSTSVSSDGDRGE